MDPEIAALKAQLKTKSGAYDAYIACIAKVVEKDVDRARLRDYVDKKVELADLGNEALGKKIDQDSEQCIEDAAG
jgi:hypothetical protein